MDVTGGFKQQPASYHNNNNGDNVKHAPMKGKQVDEIFFPVKLQAIACSSLNHHLVQCIVMGIHDLLLHFFLGKDSFLMGFRKGMNTCTIQH